MAENIEKLPWDRSTFTGRLNYYVRVTDPRLMFASDSTLNKAKNIVTTYRLDTYHAAMGNLTIL